MPSSLPAAQSLGGAAFFDLSDTPMAVLDPERRVHVVNTAWAALCGRAPAELQRLSLPEALPPRDLTTADGAPRRLRLDLQPIAQGALAMLVDVSSETAGSTMLHDDESMRDQLLQDATIGVWRFDPDTEIYHFSTGLDLGWGNTATTPLAALTLVQHREDAAADAEVRAQLTRFGGQAEREIRYRHADGSWVHLNVRYRSGRRLPSGRYEMYGLSQNVSGARQG